MGNKTDPTVTSSTTTKLSPEQQGVFSAAMPSIQQYANQPLPTLPTSTVAGFTPNETTGQNLALGAAAPGGQLAGQSANALGFLLNPSILSPDSNPYLKASGDAIQGNMTDNLLNRVLPGIRSGASMTGGPYSGGASKEGISTGLAVKDTAKQSGDALTNLYSGAYGQGLQTMLGANAQVPGSQAAQLFPSSVYSAVGADQRAMNQANLDSTNSLAQLQQMLPFLKAQDLMSLIQGMPGGTAVSKTTGSAPPGASPVSGALGGAASGAAIGSVIPGVGTVVGAGAGGLAGLLGALYNR